MHISTGFELSQGVSILRNFLIQLLGYLNLKSEMSMNNYSIRYLEKSHFVGNMNKF